MITSGEREVKAMTAKEVVRLAEWMEANGHTPEEVLECIKAIANEKEKDAEE